ncbi:MAG: hypothetical protein FWE14_00045 [Lachnospiraceae bacterium]|nr:hypothetical protein [Lachnospiraceae bacterium]
MYDEVTEVLEVHDKGVLREGYIPEDKGMESEVNNYETESESEDDGDENLDNVLEVIEETETSSTLKEIESANISLDDRISAILEALQLRSNEEMSLEAEILIAHMEVQYEQNSQLITIGIMNIVALGLIFGAFLVKSFMEWFRA